MSIKTILFKTHQQRNVFVNLAATTIRRNHDQWNDRQQRQRFKHYKKTIAAALIGSVVIVKTFKDELDKFVSKTSNNEAGGETSENIEAGEKKPGLPVYRADEVGKHNTLESFWVIYRHGVYDITNFLPKHPGGDQILNAGGLSIEPFWNVYGMHKRQPVYETLESLRIGNLHDDDFVDMSSDSLWVDEPVRDRRLVVKSRQPFNAEIPAKLIVQNLDTPNELFFVRQHMPVPELDADTHKVDIIIKDGDTKMKSFTLKELSETFPEIEIRATLMCAGNRRSDMHKRRAVRGLEWQQGAISSARWRGVLLRDVLLHAGVPADPPPGLHVILTGSDMDATGANFSTSIPLELALSPPGRVLLATHMNDAPLPRDHGAPLRALVPGAPAVRSVKWLQSITVSSEESPSHYHRGDYRSFNASADWGSADFASAPPLYSLPVTSALCDPGPGDVCLVTNGHVELKGYAYSGGGAKVLRVDVSADGGRSWHAARDMETDTAPARAHYAWTLWRACVPVPDDVTQVEIWVKATDSNFNTQPESSDHIWNLRGLLNNSYHKVTLNLQH